MFDSHSPLVRLDSANQRALGGQFDAGAPLHEQAIQAPYHGFVEVRIAGASPFLMFSNNDDVVAMHYLYRQVGFEAASLRLWVALAHQARTIVDGGAFTGVYSLSARAANPSATIWAFEPSVNTFGRLVTNIWANRFDGAIAPVLAALGDRTERAMIRHPFGVYVLGSGESLLEERVREAWYDEPADVFPLDEFEALRRAYPRRYVLERPFARLDLIKLDVEGYEAKVLAGMQKIIAADRPTMLVEFRGEASYRAIVSQLPAGARVYFIDDETLALRAHPTDFTSVDHQNLLVLLRDEIDLEALCLMAGIYLDASSPLRSAS